MPAYGIAMRGAWSQDADNCAREDLKKHSHLKRLYWWYVIVSSQLVHHRLLHPEYAKEDHSPQANEAIIELLQTDLGCAGQSLKEKTAFRAWLLRLYAMMQVQDVIALKPVRTRASLEALLDAGSRAAELALRMIEAEAVKQLQEKRRATDKPIFQRLAPTSEIDDYEALLRLKSRLSEAKKDLD